ncbi:MAG: alpha/beta fold hydrolase [Planctomycetes bacterium]|nr:alpha/beta fold hydrolase [Planctomycetota bacterium]MBI3846993.1 alpha/beta fold hydrolase [Planctomycetota bacterium]
MIVEPFRVAVREDVLDDLQERLRRTRWPDEIRGAGREQGIELHLVKRLVDRWRGEFDWRAIEASLNEFSHHRAQIDGQWIHFVRARGVGPRPFPLIVTHGWPGSFLEMLDIVPLLADPGAHGGDPTDAFDVIVPSIPGFGFSDRPTEPGTGPERVAELWHALMTGLGYSRFGAQGGDFGASIATWLALRHADSLAAIHLNYVPGSYEPWLGAGSRPLDDDERRFLADRDRWLDASGGYAHVQRTTPQTLAYATNDSPAGLAAWIVEKFRDWSDCDGDVERRFSPDALLANVTLYWVTQTAGSSFRFYGESSRRPLHLREGERVRVPTAIARFPKEEPFPCRGFVERGYDVARWTEMPRGGHFAAMEEPELLAEDVRATFRLYR